MAEPREPADFVEILTLSEPPLLVGGQAVNVWAEHFAPKDSRLEAYRPFISKDADVYGDRALAERLAAAAGWKLKYYGEPRTIAVGLLTKEIPGKENLLVEVIRSVNGLTANDLADSDLVELRPGQVYRIPSPIVLLKAKLANVAQINQVKRQDIRHVQMLIPCVREYICEAIEETRSNRMTERELVDILEAARSLCTSPRNLELAREHRFEFKEIFPPQLAHSEFGKIAKFVRFRLPGISPADADANLTSNQVIHRDPGREIDANQIPRQIVKQRDFEIGE
ncbi:MAG TPA: hypothetical protein VN877_04605 [Opitutaceae bacterium]|nr:hypothetical protein [Opitutaceae bacterium]